MASQSKKVKVECLNHDITVPDITGDILTRLPIRDAVIMSTLSKNWWFGWHYMTKLVFDDKMVKVKCDCQESKKFKYVIAILDVLSSHKGSIFEIDIDVRELDVDSDLDRIISRVLEKKHLNKLRLWGSSQHSYKLPSSFFSFEGLQYLVLTNCLFSPPINIVGLKKLHTVRFGNVDITSETLQVFLSNCPLITDLALVGGSRLFAGGNKFTLVELLKCVPSIKVLKISGPYMKTLSRGDMPLVLPTSPVPLKKLVLGVCYDKEDEVSAGLCLIRSSPELEELGLVRHGESEISKNLPGIIDELSHLNFFWMNNFANKAREVDFLKLIIAKSPELKKAQIELDEKVSEETANKILEDLKKLQILGASSSVELIFKPPNPLMIAFVFGNSNRLS